MQIPALYQSFGYSSGWLWGCKRWQRSGKGC